jgi:hypothetical protein
MYVVVTFSASRTEGPLFDSPKGLPLFSSLINIIIAMIDKADKI